jgi:transcription antitermination factor NusG
VWYVLKTKSNQEHIAEKHLCDTSVESFLPREVQFRKIPTGMKEIRKPLFPGYVFVRPTPPQLNRLRYIRGSCGLIGFDENPSPIAEGEIEGIRALLNSNHEVKVHPKMHVGTKVKLRIGQFQEVEGELIRITSHFRVVVNVFLLRKSLSIELDAREIESTSSGLRIRVLEK